MIHNGDCIDVLRTLPEQSVHCCVTSPPYWGLRDYGTATWSGGSAECDHVSGMVRGDTDRETPGGRGGSFRGGERQYTNVCAKCGATRIDRQIGLEQTPEEYVEKMVAVFREVRRVLRHDGVLWLNLGDSYAGSTSGNTKGGLAALSQRCDGGNRNPNNWATVRGDMHNFLRPDACSSGLKPKDLVGIPWRVAFALQADGWWLRQDIIWHKKNPMPESVTDRCTKAHEYIFMLTKSARYWYDAEAIAEPGVTTRPELLEFGPRPDVGYTGHMHDRKRLKTDGKWSKEDPQSSGRRIVENVKAARARGADHDSPFGPTRNRRSVWTVATQPYPEAHFATFPEKLVEPCILAGCPVGGVVLDPFAGSGTVGVVCKRFGRDFVGIELNPAYVAMAERRMSGIQGMIV